MSRSQNANDEICVEQHVHNANEHGSKSITEFNDSSCAPKVIESIKPRVGMEFQTLKNGYDFYNLYARQAGFSVRKSSQKKNKHGVVTYRQLTCYKEGKTDNKILESGKQLRRNRGETCTECKASIAFKATSKLEEKYRVFNFFEEHNHLLATPRKVHMLPSHKHLSKAKRKLIDALEVSNIRPSQQLTILEEECGGYENIGCTSKDIGNYARDKREKKKGLDAQMLKDYFEEKAEQNSSFLYTIKKDEENRVTHVFWCDAVAKTNYSKFGTVVCFDTTYKINRYDMIFAPFTGVNHHGRSILFGCAFLPTAENFVWLFKQWQEAMPGEPPRCIVIDQDLGMTKAIAQVFPNTIHRYCIWHIMDKISKYLGSLAFEKDFIYAFNDVVYNPETPDEFEVKWFTFLKRFELMEKAWLHDLYEMRGKWIPAYLRGDFFAGIQSTQRSETINKLLKEHVHKRNSFCEFMLRYERFIRRQRHLELQDDHETLNSRPRMKTSSIIKKQMADIYTKQKFFEFQNEFFYTMACTVERISEDQTIYSFLVTPPARIDNEDRSDKPRRDFDRPRIVVLQKSNSHATCSCRMFEFEDIPCRHLLTVLVRKADIIEMPKEYILERWTRDAKKGDVIHSDGALAKAIGDDSLVCRHSFLSQTWTSLVDQGSLSKEAFERAIQLFSEGEKELREINLKVGAITQEKEKKKRGKRVMDNHDNLEIYKLDRFRPKGCGKRLKPIREINHKEGRRCRGCNKIDAKHDIRNCPLRMKTSSQTDIRTPLNERHVQYESEDQEVDDESETEFGLAT